MLSADRPTIERARRLRQAMSLPEVLLWRELRKRPGGYKFRRQHPAPGAVADFYCHSARLIVEVDGRSHAMGQRPERDVARDANFEAKGIRTLRVPASEVLADPVAVAASILMEAAGASPLRPFGPPPLAGEDQE